MPDLERVESPVARRRTMADQESTAGHLRDTRRDQSVTNPAPLDAQGFGLRAVSGAIADGLEHGRRPALGV